MIACSFWNPAWVATRKKINNIELYGQAWRKRLEQKKQICPINRRLFARRIESTHFFLLLLFHRATLGRYDARNLLDDQRFFSGPRDILDESFLQDPHEEDVDDERYLDLDSDEEPLFDMDEDEREEYLGKVICNTSEDVASGARK